MFVNLDPYKCYADAPTISAPIYAMFQLTFAIMVPVVITGFFFFFFLLLLSLFFFVFCFVLFCFVLFCFVFVFVFSLPCSCSGQALCPFLLFMCFRGFFACSHLPFLERFSRDSARDSSSSSSFFLSASFTNLPPKQSSKNFFSQVLGLKS